MSADSSIVDFFSMICARKVFLECLSVFLICIILFIFSIWLLIDHMGHTTVMATIISLSTSMPPMPLSLTDTATPQANISKKKYFYLVLYEYNGIRYSQSLSTDNIYNNGQPVSISIKKSDPYHFYVVGKDTLNTAWLVVFIVVMFVVVALTVKCMVTAITNPREACRNLIFYSLWRNQKSIL